MNPSKRIRVYRYRLLSPLKGADVVADQMSMAHRYQHRLTEIEHKRRTEYVDALATHTDVGRLTAVLDTVTEERERVRQRIKAARKAARARVEDADDRQLAKDLGRRCREVRAELREAKRVAREDPNLARDLDAVKASAQGRRREARAEASKAGLYWGTYLLVEAAVQQAAKSKTPPKFWRWDWSGTVAVQLQQGLATDLVYGSDRRVRWDVVRLPARLGARKYPLLLPRLWLRVASDGKDPVWSVWPIDDRRARPLPEDGNVKWVKVHRRRVAGHFRWEVHFTVEEAVPAPTCSTGMVAVDIGWRMLREPQVGAVRVGYAVGSDGCEEEIRIPVSTLAAFGESERRQGKRSVHLAELRARALPMIRDAVSEIDGLAERTETVGQWCSAARFAALALWLRDRAPDHPLTNELETWRQHDRHHWEREVNLRVYALDKRKDWYRKVAANLADRYGTLVLEAFDLRTMAQRAPVESDSPENETARSNRHRAAVSVLRSCLEQAFRKRGGRVVEVPAANTTLRCHVCGVVRESSSFGLRHEMWWCCPSCGAKWDQDANAARNILDGAGKEGVERSGGAASRGRLSERQRRFRAAKAAALADVDVESDSAEG